MEPVESLLGIIPYDQLTLRRANRLLYAVLPAFILLLINMLTKSALCFNAQGGQYTPPLVLYQTAHVMAAEEQCGITTECGMSNLECVSRVATDR